MLLIELGIIRDERVFLTVLGFIPRVGWEDSFFIYNFLNLTSIPSIIKDNIDNKGKFLGRLLNFLVKVTSGWWQKKKVLNLK